MSHSARAKEKRRRKENQKKREARRRQSGGPYKLLNNARLIEQCWVNEDWQNQGEASIYVLCRVPGRGYAVMAFLVDIWCIGLKDAFGQLDYPPEEFDDRMENGPLDMAEMDIDETRELVAGAIRWSRQNDFALPRRYERWTAVFGPMDIDNADISGFGVDGKLRYIGSEKDLRNRLIRCSLEEFMARPDVEIAAMGIDEESLDDDDLTEFEENIGIVSDDMVDKVRQWCFANGHQPHPDLADAMEIMITAMLETELPENPDAPPEEASTSVMFKNIESLLTVEAPARAANLRMALDQFQRYISSFTSPEEFLAEMNLVEDEDEDEDRPHLELV